MSANIQRSTIAGNGLFADEDVPAGGPAFYLNRPTFAVVDSRHLPDVCSYCFCWNSGGLAGSNDDIGNSTRMKICTGCRTLRYCSKQCQASMWPSHKRECKLLGQLSSRGTLPNAVRLVLQIICRATEDEDPLSGLESHLSEIAAAASSPDEPFQKERYETLQIFTRGLFEYTGKKTDQRAIENWIALVYTNALTVTSSSFDPLGACIDISAARANHSCAPNAFVVFDGLRLVFRALRPIKKDEEILISYIDNTRQFAVRQKELSDLYYFDCRCLKCQHGATLKEDHCLKATKVESGEQRPDLVPVATSDLGPDAAAMVQQRTQKAYERLDEAGKAAAPAEALDIAREGIQHCFQYPIWPVYRQPLHSLHHEAFVALLSLQKWVLAFKLGLKMYFETYPVLYPEVFHPLRVVQKWTLVKLALAIADERNYGDLAPNHAVDMGIVILGLLVETLDNVKYSHGENHSFARAVKLKYEQVVTDMTRDDHENLTSLKEKINYQWKILRQISQSEEIDKLMV